MMEVVYEYGGHTVTATAKDVEFRKSNGLSDHESRATNEKNQSKK